MSLAPMASRMPSSVATVGGSSARSNAEKSAKLRACLSVDPRQLARVGVEPGVLSPVVPISRVHARLHQREQRRLPLRRQVEPRERRRDELRRGRFEIEQQAQRVRQVDVGEVPEHGSVDVSVEQSGKDGLAQQHLPRFRLEIEDGASQLPEHDPRDAGIERGEERRDVAELPAQGVAADFSFGDVVFGQSGGACRRASRGRARAARGRRARPDRSGVVGSMRTQPLSGG